MSISKEQAIEAIKTLKEYCESNHLCEDCDVETWCDNCHYYGRRPHKWEVPND